MTTIAKAGFNDAFRWAARGAGLAVDLILPPLALDEGPRPQGAGLTAEHWQRIHFIDGPVCDGCGAPFAYSLGEGVRCAACSARLGRFSGRGRPACTTNIRAI